MSLYKNEKIFRASEYIWQPFILKISVAILIFSLILFIILFFRNRQLIEVQHKIRARSYYDLIVVTRGWVSNYGGVYIEKKASVKSNPYLQNPDIQSTNGKIYTLRNPSLVTIEISEHAKINNIVSYHMTSLKPINPANLPDEFEKEALELFEKGENELWTKQKGNSGEIYFRYMAPVFREESCLTCHVEQQQKNSAKHRIRGGISVKFDISDIENMSKRHSAIIVFLGILSTSLFILVICFFTVRLMKKLSKFQKKIEDMAITDELTELYNRRYFYSKLNYEFEKAKRYKKDISCIMVDIDFFKKVNDNYGHHTGDNVLRVVSDSIKSACRNVDTTARYGGEEIVILLPETDKLKALLVAEKIRKIVENREIPYGSKGKIKVTISLGVAGFSSDNIVNVVDPNQLVKDADTALYRAKDGGRNRAEIFST